MAEHKQPANARLARYSEVAFRGADDAHAAYAPEAFQGWQRDATLRGDSTFAQRANGGTDRANVRAGFVAREDGRRHAAYFVRGATDPTTALHESFHLFSRELDDSARAKFVGAYNESFGFTGRNKKRKYTRNIEEWVAEEFEHFAAGETPYGAAYQSTFKAYAEWVNEQGLPAGTSKQMSDLFDDVLRRDSDIPGSLWDMDEQRIWESTRLAFMRAEDEAHSTAYYRRGRTFFERSMNHPYLGFYPASYMWGKVLPEMTRFLTASALRPQGSARWPHHVQSRLAEYPDATGD